MMRRHIYALMIVMLVIATTGAGAVEVTVGPAVPVSADVVLQHEDWIQPIDIATRDEQFGVLFSTRKDYWFSIVDGEQNLVSTHLMTAAGFHKFGLPNTGSAFWTGSEYLAFWTVGDSIHLARIGPDGELRFRDVIVETTDDDGVPFTVAWNPRIGRGLIMWNVQEGEAPAEPRSQGATFGPDGLLLETFAMEPLDEYVLDLPRLVPFGESFAGVTRLRTPDYTGRSVVELFDTSGGRTELRRFAPHINVSASPCGDALLVMEIGTVEGHTAHNVYRINAAGEVVSFATLRESPTPVPSPVDVLGCDGEGFEQVVISSAGVAIERVVGNEIVARNEWSLRWASAAARAGRYVLIAGPESYLRDDRSPAGIVEIPLLLSAKDQMPVAGARFDETDLLVLRTDDEGPYLMFVEPDRVVVRQLPQGDGHALAISPGETRALVAYVAPQDEVGGIRAVVVDLRTHEVSQPLTISTGSDIDPTVAPHPEGFLVAWERLAVQDLYTYRKEIVARVIPQSGAFPEERVILAADETGHQFPLLRGWGDGFLLLSSSGTVCWRIGCGLMEPFDLEATRLDSDLQPLWTRIIEAEPERNEIAADAACAGERCLAAWTRTSRVADPCIVATSFNSVGTSMIHAQSFSTPPVILDSPGLDDLTPTVTRIGSHWFVAWATEGWRGCEPGTTQPAERHDADIRGALFSREGSRLPVNGDDSVLIANSPGDDWYPVLLHGPDEGRLYYATVTPESGTGAAERLQRRLITIEPGDRQRAVRRR